MTISVLACSMMDTAVIDWIFPGRYGHAQQLCVGGLLNQSVHTTGVKQKTMQVSGQLTGWLLQSFGRVDDHVQKAVQAWILLIWKTSTQSSWCGSVCKYDVVSLTVIQNWSLFTAPG